MWFVFIISCIVVALAALAVVWIGNRVFLSMKRDERKFEKENVIEETED